MAQIIEKDILSITEGIITHQVNCRGKMGAGIALDIKRRFPLAYKKYMIAYENRQLKLGTIQLVKITDSLYICNLAGQDRYGRDGLYTNYEAVRKCLNKLAIWSRERKLQVYINYKMGCVSAGGDWNKVFGLINDEIPEAIVCRIPNSNYR